MTEEELRTEAIRLITEAIESALGNGLLYSKDIPAEHHDDLEFKIAELLVSLEAPK